MLRVLLVLYICASAECGNGKTEIIFGHSKQQLILDGYRYTRVRDGKKSTRWECVVRSCRATMVTSTTDTQQVWKKKQHNHEADDAACVCKKVRADLINRITTQPHQSTVKLYRNELVKLSPLVSSKLGTQHSVTKSLRYFRSKTRPPLPKSISQLIIPDALTKTKLNERKMLAL
jgi:hypothetical protein